MREWLKDNFTDPILLVCNFTLVFIVVGLVCISINGGK